MNDQALTPGPPTPPQQNIPPVTDEPAKKTMGEKFWKFIHMLEIFLRYSHGAVKGIKEAHGEIQEEAEYKPMNAEQAAQSLGPQGKY